MTKMISKIDKEVLLKDEMFSEHAECLVSDNKIELIEMVVDRMKTLEVGESVIVNLVPETDKVEKEWMLDNGLVGTNCFEKSEMIYTTGDY